MDIHLKITTPDPFNILASTKLVLENADYVRINQNAVVDNAAKIGSYLKDHSDFPDHGHRLTGDFTIDAQLIFFESMMGFCFWSLPGQDKWTTQMPDGEKVDGWYGVAAAFQRAYGEGTPVADAYFFAEAGREAIEKIFHSTNKAEIPLLDKRVAILNENAKILIKQFDGQAKNLIEAADRDAIKLFELLVKYFPSYRDVNTYKGHEVVFLKLAHLLALDFEYRLTPQSQRPFLKNFDQLCVFADYKLPQLLRMYNILEYEQSLANMIDSYQEIPEGSPQEIELRAGAIWGVELLRQQIPQYTSIQVGHVIWLASQDQALQSKIKPYHRSFSTFY